ncbi:MAG: archease [Candidatus Pacearchaeota archaeon]|nr:archease [Candidatus Pacearchaeota archaeon]
MKKSPSFEFLPHTADVKIRAYGSSLENAFKNCALALKEVITEIKIKPKIQKNILIKSEDEQSLLYEFLEQFLYLLDAKDFIISKIKKIEIAKLKNKFLLKATIIGDKASNYLFTNDVKAITYNEMLIKKENKKFIIEFVIDV